MDTQENQGQESGWVPGEAHRVSDVRLAGKALTNGWDVTPELRALVLGEVSTILRDREATRYHKLAAAKVVALCDSLNVRREGHAVQERGNELTAGAAALRAALAVPEAREALARVSEAMSGPSSPPQSGAVLGPLALTETPCQNDSLDSIDSPMSMLDRSERQEAQPERSSTITDKQERSSSNPPPPANDVASGPFIVQGDGEQFASYGGRDDSPKPFGHKTTGSDIISQIRPREERRKRGG